MKIPFLKIDESVIKNLDFDSKVITQAIVAASTSTNSHDLQALTAGGLYAEGTDTLAQDFAHTKISPSGAKFYIPIAIPEGVPSGDARSFEENSITIRDLPLPLMWQIKTG